VLDSNDFQFPETEVISFTVNNFQGRHEVEFNGNTVLEANCNHPALMQGNIGFGTYNVAAAFNNITNFNNYWYRQRQDETFVAQTVIVPEPPPGWEEEDGEDIIVAEIATDFVDIDGHWAADSIATLAQRNIIRGVSQTEFAPDREITRAEFLSLILRAANVSPMDYTGTLLDVNEDDWYAGFIQAALSRGFINMNMINNRQFRPDAPISREEMAVIAVRTFETLERQTLDNNSMTNFTDVISVSNWARIYVGKAFEEGLINGVTPTRLNPQGSATRAEAAAVVNRFWSMLQ